jgi:hypothetical protein
MEQINTIGGKNGPKRAFSDDSCEEQEEPCREETPAKELDADLPPKMRRLRQKYSQIVMREFADEENWHCDICLSKESEEDDPLY